MRTTNLTHGGGSLLRHYGAGAIKHTPREDNILPCALKYPFSLICREGGTPYA